MTADAYPLVDGIPILRPSVVAFLDTLGTKAAASDVAVQQQRLERLWAALSSDVVEFVLDDTDGEYAVSAFTDNVVIGMPALEHSDFESEYGLLLTFAGAYQLALATNGVFVRGGIALGNLWMNDSFVFGDGLIRAYELESREAVYPRVILDELLTQLAIHHGETYYKAEESPQNWALARAADGQVFVNYLEASTVSGDLEDSLLTDHRSAVIEGLFDSGNKPGVVEKYLWAAEYHNWFCRGRHPARPELLIDPQPDESKFFRLFEAGD